MLEAKIESDSAVATIASIFDPLRKRGLNTSLVAGLWEMNKSARSAYLGNLSGLPQGNASTSVRGVRVHWGDFGISLRRLRAEGSRLTMYLKGSLVPGAGTSVYLLSGTLP